MLLTHLFQQLFRIWITPGHQPLVTGRYNDQQLYIVGLHLSDNSLQALHKQTIGKNSMNSKELNSTVSILYFNK